MNDHGFITANNGHIRMLPSGRWLSVQERRIDSESGESILAWETAYCAFTQPGQPCQLLAVVEGDCRAELAAVLDGPQWHSLTEGEPVARPASPDEVLEAWFLSHEDIAIWGSLYVWTDPEDTAAQPSVASPETDEGVAP